MNREKEIDLLKRLYKYGEEGLTIDSNIAYEIEKMIESLESAKAAPEAGEPSGIACMYCGKTVLFETDKLDECLEIMTTHDRQCTANPLKQQIDAQVEGIEEIKARVHALTAEKQAKDDQLEAKETWVGTLERNNKAQAERIAELEKRPDFTKLGLEKRTAWICGMLKNVDDNFGKVRVALRELGYDVSKFYPDKDENKALKGDETMRDIDEEKQAEPEAKKIESLHRGETVLRAGLSSMQKLVEDYKAKIDCLTEENKMLQDGTDCDIEHAAMVCLEQVDRIEKLKQRNKDLMTENDLLRVSINGHQRALDADHDSWFKTAQKKHAQLKAKDERIVELEKLLKKYGRHGRTSDSVMCEREKHGDYPCTCGFEQALKDKQP